MVQTLMQPIAQNELQQPPQIVTVFIPANGGIENIHFAFKYLRIIEVENDTGNNFQLRFGDSSNFSSGWEKGLGIELPQATDNLQIKNDNTVAITLKIALGMSNIFDDRLNVIGGAIQTQAFSPQQGQNVVANVTDSAFITFAADDTINEIIIDTHDCTSRIGVYYGEDPTGKTFADCGLRLQPNTISSIKFSGIRHYIAESGTQEVHGLVTRFI